MGDLKEEQLAWRHSWRSLEHAATNESESASVHAIPFIVLSKRLGFTCTCASLPFPLYSLWIIVWYVCERGVNHLRVELLENVWFICARNLLGVRLKSSDHWGESFGVITG